MNIDIEKIEQIYGNEILKQVIENKEDIEKNINYMLKFEFDDVESIFERMTPLFITDSKTFKNKMNKLIKKIGPDYVNVIENDLGILEELI